MRTHQLITAGRVHAVDAHIDAANADGAFGGIGTGRVVLGGHQAVTGIHRHRAGRAQIDVAETEHHVAGVVNDTFDRLDGIQPVDAADELHVVGQPGGVRADGFLIALYRVEGGAVLERQWQVHHPGGHHQIVHGTDGRFPFQQRVHQILLVQYAGIVVHLQAAHAGRQLKNAVHRFGFQ